MTSLADVIGKGRKQKHVDSASISVFSNIPEQVYTQPEHVIATVVPKFDANDPEMVKYLAEHGYVVVSQVLQPEETAIAVEMFWQFLSDCGGMLPNDPTSWTDDNFKRVGSKSSGIIGRAGFGNSDAQWFIRTRTPVKTVFAHVHGDADLIASFDGGNVFRPWHGDAAFASLGVAPLSACTSSGWFHVDQGRLQRGPGVRCVQGLVSLTDCSGATGGFCCIPGSQHSHDDLVALARDDGNYFQVPASFPQLSRPQILPVCSAGDMILWDSRTIHCSTPALDPPSTPVNRLLRMASYQCMTPRRWASDDVVATRMQAYKHRLTTTHWPHLADYSVAPLDPDPRVLSSAPDNVRALVGSV